ncbi:MAG: adenine deaminase [Syntrophobacteraceae bacterium]|nr:adenine deaminase [Syntrophobacteraceae bacterium]
MRDWSVENLGRLIDAARGHRPVDFCIRGCRMVNVFSGAIETVNLGIDAGFIVGWGDYEAERSMEAQGMFACPGFIDGHIHIESTMLSPAQFAAAVLPWGTTAVVADPHELANVYGLDGIRYLLEAVEGIPLDFYFNLPSCVPASPLETSGARLSAADLHGFKGHPRILGLAEVMNFPGVLMGVPEIMEKLLMFRDVVLDGHAPGLGGLGLNGYVSSGIRSDHECTSLDEAREKLARGMTIMIREGSQSKDLAALLPVVGDQTWPQCMFVSDDRHPDDLWREGHMNTIVNRAMSMGMEPVRALTLASWTPARYFGLSRRGAIAPGFHADLTLSPTLSPWNPLLVFKDGVEVVRDGKLSVDPTSWPAPAVPASPMRITRILPEDLKVPLQEGPMHVIGAREGTLLTRKLFMEPRKAGGLAMPDVDRDLLKLVVWNRYVEGRKPSVAFATGFGLKRGALATTVAHDSHNLVGLGASDAAILRVAEAVRACGGGMAVGAEDGDLEVLPLPIGGLMSNGALRDVVERFDRLNARSRALGCSLSNPFMALSFLALPVIPELKLTDLGLVDVASFSFVPLFESK